MRVALLALFVLLAVVPGANAATFTVTTNADSGAGSLRAAIDSANLNGGLDEIVFSAGMTITPTTVLPSLTGPTTVNGRISADCTGMPRLVILDGSAAGTAAFDGLTFAAGSDGSRVCALNVRSFQNGIVILSDGVTVVGCRIGINLAGTAADGNSGDGISISGDDATIGGAAADLNIISGNGGAILSQAVDGTTIDGNWIGLDGAGTAAIPNTFGGVSISVGATSAVVGGTAGNVIGGNGFIGLDLGAGTARNNLVGTDASGNVALPNGTEGVRAAAGTTVGGPTVADRNVISGNASIGVFVTGAATIQGNFIGPAASGAVALAGQDDGVALPAAATGSMVKDNVISGNTIGVEAATLTGAATIQGNTIGLTPLGGNAMPNTQGIRVGTNATGVQIGGTAAGQGNTIGGNTASGVLTGGSGTIVEGNSIGLGTGGIVLGNEDGVQVTADADGTRIGGTTAGARNVISANSDAGILLDNGSTGTTVQGNIIGLGADGTTVAGNDRGIEIEDSTDALIGGTAAGAGNVISGNLRDGIFVDFASSTGLVIEQNLLGTDATGTLDRGNGDYGIYLRDAPGARIGGTAATAGNVISGNELDGISVGDGTPGTVVQGNRVGVTADGSGALGNVRAGVSLINSPSTATVGGTVPGAGNVIAHNGQDGVEAIGAVSGGAILANSIRGNGSGNPEHLGIDVVDGGVTPNDPGDVDDATLANRAQNFPVLTAAQTDGAATVVEGTIDTTPGASIRVELFSSAACDDSGHGQGDVFLGAHTVTAGAGATAFTATVGATGVGRQITATATDLGTNETSEFSACRAAAQTPAPPVVTPPVTTTPTIGEPAPPPPPVVVPPPPPAPRFPAKIRVLRNGIDDGVLDMLVEITARAVVPGAVLSIDYESSGRHTRFTVPITGTQVKVRKALPSSQPKDTGITTVTYAGNSIVLPDDVRLRAADGKSLLTRGTTEIRGGELVVAGTVTKSARGVVRIRLGFNRPDGTTGFESWNATIADGAWSVRQRLTGDAARGGQLSIQFTGYEARGLRGEQTAKEVLP